MLDFDRRMTIKIQQLNRSKQQIRNFIFNLDSKPVHDGDQEMLIKIHNLNYGKHFL